MVWKSEQISHVELGEKTKHAITMKTGFPFCYQENNHAITMKTIWTNQRQI